MYMKFNLRIVVGRKKPKIRIYWDDVVMGLVVFPQIHML